MTRVLYDINVILDVLADRQPHADASAASVGLAERGRVEGVLAAHTLTTLHYLLERDAGTEGARRALTALLGFLAVEPVDAARLRQALAMDWADFEDAVQAVCAQTAGADCLVTQDRSGFKGAGVRVVGPTEFVSIMGQGFRKDRR